MGFRPATWLRAIRPTPNGSAISRSVKKKSAIGSVRRPAERSEYPPLRPGDLISGFMKRIGLADHVIVVLSDKYLRSPYCMTELHTIYQRSVGEKEDFLRRIIPLRLADARFGTWRDRLV
jgi:hypothetical protein